MKLSLNHSVGAKLTSVTSNFNYRWVDFTYFIRINSDDKINLHIIEILVISC